MEKHKITNIHPGLILKEDVILPAGISISYAAEIMQISKITLSKILNGLSPITPNIALRIETVFGGKADFWLRMQRGFDLSEAKFKFELNPPNIKQYKFQIA
jgi:antitoxin HigA-1